MISLRTRFPAVLLLFVLLPCAAQAQLYVDEQFGFQVTSGVVYTSKPVGDPPMPVDLRLELYEPTGAGVPSNRPVVVAIHGGSFTSGSRFSSFMLAICQAMATRGWTCVSIDYRLAGDDPVVGAEYATLESLIALSDPALAAPIAAATEDTVAVLDWLQDNAVDLDIDPSRIGLAGYSAGGVLTEMTAYVADDTGVVLPVAVQASYNISGSVDPSTTVQGDEAPVLMSHGDLDTVVPIAGAYALRDAADAVDVTNELIVLTGRGHTDFNIFNDEVSPGVTVFDRFVSFFYIHVAGVPAVPALGSAGRLAVAALLGVLSLLFLRYRARSSR